MDSIDRLDRFQGLESGDLMELMDEMPLNWVMQNWKD